MFASLKEINKAACNQNFQFSIFISKPSWLPFSSIRPDTLAGMQVAGKTARLAGIALAQLGGLLLEFLRPQLDTTLLLRKLVASESHCCMRLRCRSPTLC